MPARERSDYKGGVRIFAYDLMGLYNLPYCHKIIISV